MRIAVMVVATVLVCGSSPSFAQDFGKKVGGAWKDILGLRSQDGEYRWSGYPVDNFGLGTFYDPPPNKAWTDADRICATWSCLGVALDRIPPFVASPLDAKSDPRLSLNGFADVGGGGTVTLSNSQSRDIGFKLLLPGLAQVLNIGGGIDWKRGVTTQVTIQRIYKRSANRDKWNGHVATTPNRVLQTAFTNNRMSWIAADILAAGVELVIKVNNATNANANAALAKAAGTVSKDSSLEFKWASATAGEYKLVINHPVVLAVQTRRQPAANELTDVNIDAVVDRQLPSTRFVAGRPAEK